jgi:hypothetical protein
MLLLSEPARGTPQLSSSTRLATMATSSTDDVMALFRAHAAAVSARCGEDGALELDPDTALSLGAECLSAWLDEARTEGRLVPSGDELRFSGLGALKMAFWFRYRSGGPAAHAANARLGLQEAPPPAALEARRFRQLEEVSARPLTPALAALLFVLSAIGFLLWFGLSDPMFGAALFATVLFHEAGHASAMRVFGYRDPRIYFLPGLGGATVGHKRDASIHAEAVVLLAGPLPGIVLGLLLWVASRHVPESMELAHHALVTTALVLVLVNTLNLVPAVPFDGGRLAHRIVGGLHPAVDIVFRLLSIAAIGLLALVARDVLLGVLALLLAFQTPSNNAAANVESDLRKRGAADWTEDQRIEEAFRALALRGWARRYTAVKQIDLRLAAPEASVLARTSWALIYVALVIGIPIGAVIVLVLGELASQAAGG